MKLIKLISVLLVISVATGCATNKVLQATGGSKSDGTVMLSYQVGGFEKPIVNWDDASYTAGERCRAWGYSGAEPFGGTTQQCVQFNGYGCIRTQFNIQYQCTGKL